MISFAVPIFFIILLKLHRSYLNARNYLLDEKKFDPPLGEPAEGSYLHLLIGGVENFKLVEFLRFFILNLLMSILILAVVALSGASVTQETSILGSIYVAPAFVGYLDAGSLFVATILLLRSNGQKKAYKFYFNVISSILSIPVAISLVKNQALLPEFEVILSSLPVLYFRNILTTSLFAFILLPAMGNEALQMSSRQDLLRPAAKLTLLVLILLSFSFLSGSSQIRGLRFLLYFATGEVIFPGLSLIFLSVITILFLRRKYPSLYVNKMLVVEATISALGVYLSFDHPYALAPLTVISTIENLNLWIVVLPLEILGAILLTRRPFVGIPILFATIGIASVFGLQWTFLLVIPMIFSSLPEFKLRFKFNRFRMDQTTKRSQTIPRKIKAPSPGTNSQIKRFSVQY